jgi:hypothetical protein
VIFRPKGTVEYPILVSGVQGQLPIKVSTALKKRGLCYISALMYSRFPWPVRYHEPNAGLQRLISRRQEHPGRAG